MRHRKSNAFAGFWPLGRVSGHCATNFNSEHHPQQKVLPKPTKLFGMLLPQFTWENHAMGSEQELQTNF
jgi:hypothetical protein